MKQNYDFIDVGENKTVDSHRILLSVQAVLYSPMNEATDVLLLITKESLTIENEDTMLRKLDLHEIDAITISEVSNEFIFHIFDDEDERLSCEKHRREVFEMILYILTIKKSNKATNIENLPIYFVNDANLDLYVTSEDDLEDGHTIRPDDKHMLNLDYKGFIERQDTIRLDKPPGRRNTRSISSKPVQNMKVEDFEFLKVLGKGAHGKVLLSEKKTGDKGLYAMKILKKKHIIDNNQLEHTRAEKNILSYISHPFLVSLQYAFQTDQKIYFVMEFMRGGELFQHLKKVKQFTENQAKHITACLVLALGHLHNNDYIYRDLKPENVLMDHDGYCKLTDFGLAKNLPVADLAKTFCGTPEYLAPEIIMDKGSNRPVDWWSLGVLVYEMIFGIPPFYSTNVQKMYKNTILNPLKFKKHTTCSDEVKDFIAGLLMKKPKQRLGSTVDALEVLSHPWFRDFDWQGLINKTIEMPYKPMSGEQSWEQNFDPAFIKQKPSDSVCWVDPKFVSQFKKDFEDFDFMSDNFELESRRRQDFKDGVQNGDKTAERFAIEIKTGCEVNFSTQHVNLKAHQLDEHVGG